MKFLENGSRPQPPTSPLNSSGNSLPTKKFVELRMDDVATTEGERELIPGLGPRFP